MTREDVQAAWDNLIDKGISHYDSLSHDEQVWFNIEPLTTDGIIDHYINNGAEHNADAIAALEFLGFPDLAALMRKVNSLFFAGNPPVDIDERNQQWDSLSTKHDLLLDEVDEQFWSRTNALEDALLVHIVNTKIGINSDESYPQ